MTPPSVPTTSAARALELVAYLSKLIEGQNDKEWRAEVGELRTLLSALTADAEARAEGVPRPGWFARQAAKTAKNIDEWPEWMRREAGMANPKNNALNRARTRIAELEAQVTTDDEARARLVGALEQIATFGYGTTGEEAANVARAALDGRTTG